MSLMTYSKGFAREENVIQFSGHQRQYGSTLRMTKNRNLLGGHMIIELDRAIGSDRVPGNWLLTSKLELKAEVSTV